MDENKSLNEKYKKIDDTEIVAAEEVPQVEDKPKKVKKEKDPKPPKEKKVKEPKAPKEKKVKEPKPPKEKKVKEPKPPKEKKVKEPKPPKEKKVKEPKPPKEKKVKEPKPPKEKKAKEPKPQKEEKIKEPKPVKEKKVKEPKPVKEKKVKEPKVPKEKKVKEPLKAKDYLTIAIALVAVAMVVAFVGVKYFPKAESEAISTTTPAPEVDKLSTIQLAREGVQHNLIQSDIPDVFYGFSTDYTVQYYQYRDNQMRPVKSTGKLTTSIDMGNEVLPIEIEYVELAGKIFGIGAFRADKYEDVYFYDMMIFKLTNLPEKYAQENKALLLATTSEAALTQGNILWQESFTIDLNNGTSSRFLKIINRTIDMTGAGVTDFCMITRAGYESNTQNIPFLTSRQYGTDSGKQDIFIKNGSEEKLFAENVYGKFYLIDGESVLFMRKNETGFDVVKKVGDEETVTQTFYGSMANYTLYNQYLLGKNDGKLYNLFTGEEKSLVGYSMNIESMMVSDDGKYLVMMGTVKNINDYQIHIFNLETGQYAKFVDRNYSAHSNLTFINNTTVSYVVLDPNQGYEYVVLDLNKVEY